MSSRGTTMLSTKGSMLRRHAGTALRAAAFALCALASFAAHAQRVQSSEGYTGSAACKDCHQSEYDRWQKTRMANVIVDPKKHPEAIVGDFQHANPLVTFKKNDIAFVYGS